jgi:AcrR family transcriptional regulator
MARKRIAVAKRKPGVAGAIPKWNRRKEARPGEIVSAAIDVFAEKGFAAAKLDDVARRAGIAKGTLYRYFDTKEDMFRAVVREGITTRLEETEAAASAFEGSIADFVRMLLTRAAGRLGENRLPAIARMVLAESRAFPDLAALWHDQLIARMLALITGMISRAQARGEVRPGDPKLYAFSILGPMATATLLHEVLGSSHPAAPDLDKLAAHHAEIVLHGLLVSTPTRKRTP